MSNYRCFPLDGCVVFILRWIRSSIDKALQSPWLSHVASDPPIPDPVEVVERPSSPTMLPSPSSIDQPRDFVIFLSFRGEDTRNGFTGHLYSALSKRSLKTFIDSKDLHKGETIDQLFGYIERSKVFVPIISERYAESKWCLKEIAKIVNCARDGRLILPIFFGVEPSDVRHQTGPFKNHFTSYDNDRNMDKKEVKEWREALKTVSNLSGYSHNVVNGHEATLVDKVVSDLLRHLDTGRLIVADHPVGIESRIEDMMNLLQIERDGVKMVGVVGTGGLGKTTIAKAVFNKLRANFGAATFVSGIRESWKIPSSQTRLMRQLVEDILEDVFTAVHDIATGQRLLNERVPCKKVLIVLDDIDDTDQFKMLIGERLYRRFTSGSRIIITTRDKSVLTRCGIDEDVMYKPLLLDTDQSLHLFSSYAFQNCHQLQDMYRDMSMNVVAVAGGLPLALKVFGSYLSDKTDLGEWKEYLDKLHRSSESDIQKCLQISYDALRNDSEKQIFLDIACFFHGHSQIEATHMWESLNWQPKAAINELHRKSLIVTRDDGEYEMHDLIRNMGRDIVRQVQPNKPVRWSRIWIAHDAMKALRNNLTNDDIEGITLDGTGNETLSTEAFGKMTSLRILRVDNINCFEGENFTLPEDLKVLGVRLAKAKSLASCNFENLTTLEIHVADELSEIFVRESATQVFYALKFLKISCHTIRVTPDFSNMPHLEYLEFSYCASLVGVHESIGNLEKLKYLAFLQFLNVEKLPDTICQLTSLETLRINQFPRLESLPDRLGDLESLNELELQDLAITTIPSSVGQLNKLHKMYLRRLDRLLSLPDSISNLNALQVFNIEGTKVKGLKIDGVDLMHINRLEISSCNCLTVLPTSSLKKAKALYVTDGTVTDQFPKSIEAMENIEQLSLICKNLMALPDWLPNLKNLKTFEVDCESLASIISKIFSLRTIETLSLRCAKLEELPADITEIFVENIKSITLRCKNLRALPKWIGSLASLEFLKLEACENITELPLCIGNLSRLQELTLNGCKRIRSVSRLPSSLLVLDASNCSDLGETLDVSNLKSLQKLRLGGCALLEDVQGIENSAHNIEELVLPGPYNSIDCSRLNDDFKRKVFKELAFENLRRHEICGSLAQGSTDHQQLSFMLPNIGASRMRLVPRIERLVLNKVPSLIHVKLVEDDHRVIFQSALDIQCPIVKNFFRPIWNPLPRTHPIHSMLSHINTELRYSGQLIGQAIPQAWGTLIRWISIPCHDRCALSSISALHGSEAVEVEEEAEEQTEVEEEEVVEDGGIDQVVQAKEAEDVQHGGGNRVGYSTRKTIQVFQPNRVPFFVASYPCFIYWQHECSEESCDYKVDFKKEDLIQEHLRVADHPTVLVSADTSNLTTIRMAFSFVGEGCEGTVRS